MPSLSFMVRTTLRSTPFLAFDKFHKTSDIIWILADVTDAIR